MQADRLTVEGINNVLFADRFSGSDIGAQVNNAISALPAGGGIVQLPAGTLVLTTFINLNNLVHLRGHGRGATILTTSNTTGDMLQVNADKCLLENFTLTRSVTATSGNGINVGAHNDCHIINCHINSQYVGIAANASSNFLTVMRTTVDGCVSDGCQLQGGSMIFIANEIFYNGGNGASLTSGGGFQSSAGNQYFGNKGRGIQIFGNGQTQSFHNGDIIDSNGGEGFFVQNMKQVVFLNGWVAASGVSFNGQNPNYTTYANKAGVFFDSSVSCANLANSILLDNGGNGVWFNGTAEIQCNNNFIGGNNQSGAGSAGIAVVDGTTKWASATLSNNRVTDLFGIASPAQHQQTGLQLGGGAGGNVTITGGDYTGNTSAALTDTSTATKKYLGAVGIPDQTSDSLTVGGAVNAPTATLTAAAPTVAAGQVGLGSGTATTATAGTNGAVPTQVAGYLIVNIGGTNVKVPYYNN